MLQNSGSLVSEGRRVMVVDVYNDKPSEANRKINEEYRQIRQKINASALYNNNNNKTPLAATSRTTNGSAEAVKLNGHPEKGDSDFVTVLRVDDTQEDTIKARDAQNFVTILQVNEMMRSNRAMVAMNGTLQAISTRGVVETVTVYRLPGERLGMALKFEGGDTNTSAPVSKVLIQSIQPDSPAARAESGGPLLGRLQEGDNILDIDGRDVTTLTRLDCVSSLRDASVCIKLKVKRELRTNGVMKAPPAYEDAIRGREPLEDGDDRPKIPSKKKGPPPIPPRKTACLTHSTNVTTNHSFAKSFEKDFASVEGVKEKIQRLECVQSTPGTPPPEKVLKRPSHPPPLPPRRPRSGSESASDAEDGEKTPTFPGGSVSTRLPGWEELMQRRAERFVESQCQGLPAQPSIYVDLFAEEDDRLGIESESDDTGSSVSTVIEKFSRGSTANSSFSEIHHGGASSSGPHFDLKQVLSPFEQLERELDEAAQTIPEDQDNPRYTTEKGHGGPSDITILPPESFQDGALNLPHSNSFYKPGSSPISPPGDSGLGEDIEDDEDECQSPNSPMVFAALKKTTSSKNDYENIPSEVEVRNGTASDQEDVVDTAEKEESQNSSHYETDNEEYVDDPKDVANNLQKSEDENEEFVDGPVAEIVNKETMSSTVDVPPAVPQKREVPKPPPVPPRLSIPKTGSPKEEVPNPVAKVVPPKTPDPKERPRSAKVIPTSLLEPTVVGAIEKKPAPLNQSPDRSRKAVKDATTKPVEAVKLRVKNGSQTNRRPKSLVLSDLSKPSSDIKETVRRPRSLSLEDADGTLMSRLREIASPGSSALPSKIPRPTFLTSPITGTERSNFLFEKSSSATVSRSNSFTNIDREPTSLPSSLNGEKKLLSRSESFKSCSVEAIETTVTKVVKGKDNAIHQIQQSTTTECKASETRGVKAASRFGFAEKTEVRRVNFSKSSSSSATRTNTTSNPKAKDAPAKKKLFRSHSAQGDLSRPSKEESSSESPKSKKKAADSRPKENVKSSPAELSKSAPGELELITATEASVSLSSQKIPATEEGAVEKSLSSVETSILDDQDESPSGVTKTPDETSTPSSTVLQNGIEADRQMDLDQRPIEGSEQSVDEAPRVEEQRVKVPDEVEESVPKDSNSSGTLTDTDSRLVRLQSSTVEVINPAFQEHYGDWLGDSFQIATQDGGILILGASDIEESFTLLDDVLRTEEEPLQFRVEVGMPRDLGCGSEMIELQPGQSNVGFFNQTVTSGADPFSGDNGCKSAFGWNLSRWPLQDVPEEEEPIEEEQDQGHRGQGEVQIGARDQLPSHSEQEHGGRLIGESVTLTEEVQADHKSEESSGTIEEKLVYEEERPLAEGSSPVTVEKSLDSIDSGVESPNPERTDSETNCESDESLTREQSQTESAEDTSFDEPSSVEGEPSTERCQQSGDEMDIYFSGPPSSYRFNQHQVTSKLSREVDFKASPPPPTYSRAPPDGHEFPPNYREPDMPIPPASLPPKMPAFGDKVSGEKATLVREMSATTSLSRSFSLSSPPEYLPVKREELLNGNVAFHNHRNQQNLAGRLTNGAGDRWNSEECLSKNLMNGGSSRLFSRRESDKSPSVRDRIALFSKPEVPVKNAAPPPLPPTPPAIYSTTKSIALSPPKREAPLPIKTEEMPKTNGEAKELQTEMNGRTVTSAIVIEPTILKTKREEVSSKMVPESGPPMIQSELNRRESSPPMIQSVASRRESSPYISNYPQTQLASMRYSYGGQKLADDFARRSSLGSIPPPYLDSRRHSTTKLKGLVIPDKANFVPKSDNRLPTIIRSSNVTSSFASSYEKPISSLSVANTFQARSNTVVETAKPSMAVSLDAKSGQSSPAWKQTQQTVHKVAVIEQPHLLAFKSNSLDLPKTPLSGSSVAATVSSSSLSSLTGPSVSQVNASKQSTFQFSLSHSKPVTPTLPEKPIIVSPTPYSPINETNEKVSSVNRMALTESGPPPLPATRPPTTSTLPTETTSSVRDINQNSVTSGKAKPVAPTENQHYSYKSSTNSETARTNSTMNKLSALDRLDSLVLTNTTNNKINEETKYENSTDNVNNNLANGNASLNNHLNNARNQSNTYVEQVITREDIMAMTSNNGAVTPDFMSCDSSVFSSSSTNDSRLWSIRPSESDDDTNSVISLRTEDSRQTADDSLSDATTDSLDKVNNAHDVDLKPRRLSQQRTVLRARTDSVDSVKNFRALAERWEMRAGDTTPDSSARSTPSVPPPPPPPSLPLTRRDSGRSSSSSVTECNVKLPPSLHPRNGSETTECKDKPSSPTGRSTRDSRSYSITNDPWTTPSAKETKLESLPTERSSRKVSSLERSASSFNLDSTGAPPSLDSSNNRVNKVLSSHSGFGKSSRSVSVSDIRKTFESQLKSEAIVPPPKISEPETLERSSLTKRESGSLNSSLSPSSVTSYSLSKDSRNGPTLLTASTEIHHKRFSSMDSTASDSGVSTPAHYGSTSSLAAPYSGSREHFGSVTSLASTSSLISPQELQQLIDEANLSLSEELSISGSSVGHEISVVVLHKDSLTGSVGITLAGGADYETKEITIHKIIAGSLADRDDRLRKGDRIVSINGKNLRGVTHREALEILKSPRQEVVLVISRERLVSVSPCLTQSSSTDSVKHPTNESLQVSSKTERVISQPRLSTVTSTTEKIITSERVTNAESSVSQTSSSETPSGTRVIIKLIKDGAGLGFSLEGGKDSPFGDKPLIVKRVFKGGAADREGTLKSRDEIVSVNHQTVSNMTRTEAWNFMKKLQDGTVTIVVRKG